MIDAWTDRLSEHVDGTLGDEEGALLEAHLATCEACRATRAELSAVATWARALPERLPATDLWPGVEARIAAFARDIHARADHEARGPGAHPSVRSFPGGRRGILLSWPQLAAAGLTLVALSSGAAWYIAGGGRAAVPASVAQGGGDSARVAHSNAQSAGAVDRELDQLERVLIERRNELDPETVRTIESNLAIIDLATSQARQALAADPANPYLKEHLSKTMKRKIEMLREATVLASAQ